MKYLLILISLALTSCGGGGGSSAPPTTSPTYDSSTILAFSATTNPATSPTSIDPAINSGQFTVSWTIKDATVTNAIGMYFSTSSTFNAKDPTVFAAFCIPGTACGVKTYTTSCSFNSSNVMECPALKGISSTSGVDLTQYIADAGGLHLNGYLILYSCNPISAFCDTKAIPVTLQ